MTNSSSSESQTIIVGTFASILGLISIFLIVKFKRNIIFTHLFRN